MGRPKRPFNGVEAVTPINNRWGKASLPGIGLRQQRRYEASSRWTPIVANGIYDPLTYMFVLDALVLIDPDIELRTHKLVTFLKTAQPQLSWDTITVGKVLADIRTEFERVLGKGSGLLEGKADYKGNFHYIHHYPDVIALYREVRDELMAQFTLEQQRRTLNMKVERMTSPLLSCASMRGDAVAIA